MVDIILNMLFTIDDLDQKKKKNLGKQFSPKI